MCCSDVVVEREKPALRLEHDRERGELFRRGTDVRTRVGLERDPVGEVRHPVRLREQGAAVAPHTNGPTRRVRPVEARHDLVRQIFRIRRERFVAQERDLVLPLAIRVLRIVAGDQQLQGVRARARGPAAEALDPAPESAEAADLGSVRAEHAHRHVDRDLVDLSEHEVVLAQVHRVAHGVAGGERARERTAALQFRALSGEPGGSDQEGETGSERGTSDTNQAVGEGHLHCVTPVFIPGLRRG